MAVYASNLSSKGPFANIAPPGIAGPVPPAGAFVSGTKVQVGTHRVIIDRYLSEGGFAHVYVVKLPRPVEGNDKAVLKRVAVPDKEHLANMRTEVETMKRLRGQKHIVKYIDSHASQLKGGGYEVFLLMEFCQGGGLIDFMNTRLQNRLTEPEIMKIFTDVAEGVACMHYLKPPLLHRDLKVENVLISTTGSSKMYKLCDFGSAASPRPAATSAAEGRLIEDDVQRHTTLQYRSPEMIDVYRKQPIDEKSDIWALGVFLYKLCYYTTPFEEVGQMAILNAKFKYPGYPRFSDQMKLLIASMLREKPNDRPNIYQVLQKACQMDGRDLPVRDIYSHRSKSESRKDQVLPQSPSSSQSKAGATLSPKDAEASSTTVPDIAPMRRGRPTKPVSHHGSAKPSPSPLRMVDSSDPFAALDGNKGGPADELSTRFPTLDQFSLMTDRGKMFSFEPQSEKQADSRDPELAKRVTDALADDAFIRSPSPTKDRLPAEKPSIVPKSQAVLAHKTSMEKREASARMSLPVSLPQKSAMVSTGTMTLPSPPLTGPKPVSDNGIWKVPSYEAAPRPASLGTSTATPRASTSAPKSGSRLANLLREDASRSQRVEEQEPKSPTSSRPSLEGGRPTMRDLDKGVGRSRSLNLRNRPASVNVAKGPTHVKDREIAQSDYETNFVSAERELPDSTPVESDTYISSDIDFLKAREEEERERHRHHKRLSSGSRHGKRSSLPHISLAGTKNLLTGRFGDAFKKFEGGHESLGDRDRSHSPSKEKATVLTPIAGSEATDLSDDRYPFDETEDLSPEMRRELEKRRLEAEEKRVANAAAEYRQRLASRGGGGGGGGAGVAKAASIQNKVQSLLKENDKPPQKTATGYGRFTNDPVPVQTRQFEKSLPYQPPPVPSNVSNAPTTALLANKSVSAPSSAVNLPAQEARSQRPTAPPKPKILRTGRTGDSIQGTSNAPPNGVEPVSPEDWETNFSKRYPSLTGLEMVETDIDSGQTPSVKTREV